MRFAPRTAGSPPAGARCGRSGLGHASSRAHEGPARSRPGPAKGDGAVLAHDAPTPATIQAHTDATKKQTEAFAAAFEKDTFDAKKLDLSTAPGKKPTDAIDRQIKYLGQLLPILTAGQRDRFAAMMDHPRDRGPRRFDHRGARPGGGQGR